MSHDNHQATPYYSPGQVLVDLCAECAEWSANPGLAIEHLDPVNFAQAWHRAMMFGHGEVEDASDAEIPVLRVLWAIALQLERAGWQFGVFPSADFAAVAS